jgi:hypothetical protein
MEAVNKQLLKKLLKKKVTIKKMKKVNKQLLNKIEELWQRLAESEDDYPSDHPFWQHTFCEGCKSFHTKGKYVGCEDCDKSYGYGW